MTDLNGECALLICSGFVNGGRRLLAGMRSTIGRFNSSALIKKTVVTGLARVCLSQKTGKIDAVAYCFLLIPQMRIDVNDVRFPTSMYSLS